MSEGKPKPGSKNHPFRKSMDADAIVRKERREWERKTKQQYNEIPRSHKFR